MRLFLDVLTFWYAQKLTRSEKFHCTEEGVNEWSFQLIIETWFCCLKESQSTVITFFCLFLIQSEIHMYYPLILNCMNVTWPAFGWSWSLSENPVFPQSHLHKQVHCMPFLCPLCVLLLKVLLLLHLTWLLLSHLTEELPVLYQKWNFGAILIFLLLSSISGNTHQLIRLLKAFCTPTPSRISLRDDFVSDILVFIEL